MLEDYEVTFYEGKWLYDRLKRKLDMMMWLIAVAKCGKLSESDWDDKLRYFPSMV